MLLLCVSVHCPLENTPFVILLEKHIFARIHLLNYVCVCMCVPKPKSTGEVKVFSGLLPKTASLVLVCDWLI